MRERGNRKECVLLSLLSLSLFRTKKNDGWRRNAIIYNIYTHSCISIQASKPILKAIGVPIALHKLYRPPTQSQNPNMLVVSIPKADTAAAFVDNAAKCLAMHVGSLLYLDNNHALAVPAFVIVSCVVNLYIHTRRRRRCIG